MASSISRFALSNSNSTDDGSIIISIFFCDIIAFCDDLEHLLLSLVFSVLLINRLIHPSIKIPGLDASKLHNNGSFFFLVMFLTESIDCILDAELRFSLWMFYSKTGNYRVMVMLTFSTVLFLPMKISIFMSPSMSTSLSPWKCSFVTFFKFYNSLWLLWNISEIFLSPLNIKWPILDVNSSSQLQYKKNSSPYLSKLRNNVPESTIFDLKTFIEEEHFSKSC